MGLDFDNPGFGVGGMDLAGNYPPVRPEALAFT
jgi:hypothetical protein